MNGRFWAVPLGVVAGALLFAPTPAAAAPDACAITGYSAPAPDAAAALALERPEVAPAGTPLHHGATWLIPRGKTPVVVIRGGTLGDGSRADIVVAGVARHMTTGGTRDALYAVADSGFGTVTREAGVDLRIGSCVARFTVVADRPIYQTGAGILGGAALLIGVVGAVLLLRWRRVRIVWRGLLAAPFAVVAGIGEAALLHESGAASPFDRWIWFVPVGSFVLLLVAMLWLGLVQKGRRSVAVSAPSLGPAAAAPAPEAAAVTRPLDALPSTDAAATQATMPGETPPAAETLATQAASRPPNSAREADTAAAQAASPLPNPALEADTAAAQAASPLPNPALEADTAATQPPSPPPNPALEAEVAATQGANLFPNAAVEPETAAQAASPSNAALEAEMAATQAASTPSNAAPEAQTAAAQGAIPRDALPAAGAAPAEPTIPRQAAPAADAAPTPAAIPRDALASADLIATPTASPAETQPSADAAPTQATNPPAAYPAPGLVVPVPAGEPASKRRAGAFVPVVAVVVLLAAAFAVAWPRQPAAAVQAETVDPAAARIVFTSVWSEGRAGRFDRFEQPATIFVSGLLESYSGLRTNEITNLEVGLPRGQNGYPAYFVATARSAMGDGRTGFIYALMTRDGPTAPWTMRDFRMSTAESYSVRPKMSDGYLAPLPPVADLAFDPATSAQRFADWVNRSAKAGKVVSDEVLALDGIGDDGITDIATKFAGARGPSVYRAYTVTPGEVRPELVPLVDGTVQVSFAVDVRIEVFNNNRPAPRSCATSWLLLNDTDRTHYQTLTLQRRKHPVVAVPLKGGAKAILKDNVEREISATGKRC
ncbi:hypothetical protein DFJ67_0959 [Asanoa ferruginea]|uniref:Uncharacterized protein n=1 Tax=Asanoa ferruginea TaxID=53367 RepID=A0A3D9ZEX5_9ACTN|nr:hypothetical protein [Asanoa ferruginea]REF95012.1 hypothetical protein DFJ67_0959 [Asanoa ferruginea]GIF48824.1 hypothetical protein Afe04nite_33630 [Asanoa ferruginea]